MSSPCAMLMTPIRPNTMASPSAIRSRIDASEAPWNTVSTVRTSRLQRSICRMAWVAASRSAGEAPASAASVSGAEEGLDGDRRPPVGGDLGEARHGDGAERLAVVGRRDLDQLRVAPRRLGAADHHLHRLALGPRVDVAIAERAEEREPLRIPAGAERVHRRLALVAVVHREVGESLESFRRLRVARRGSGEPRHEQQQQQTLHQAFFWKVPWCLTQSQPLSGLVYFDHGSGSTSPLVREMILNWPSLRISPMSTGR